MPTDVWTAVGVVAAVVAAVFAVLAWLVPSPASGLSTFVRSRLIGPCARGVSWAYQAAKAKLWSTYCRFSKKAAESHLEEYKNELRQFTIDAWKRGQSYGNVMFTENARGEGVSSIDVVPYHELSDEVKLELRRQGKVSVGYLKACEMILFYLDGDQSKVSGNVQPDNTPRLRRTGFVESAVVEVKKDNEGTIYLVNRENGEQSPFNFHPLYYDEE